MKKVKIMLMAIALLATVGGVVAFKATKVTRKYCTNVPLTNSQGVKYCEDTFNGITQTCPTLTTTKITGSGTDLCYTTIDATATSCPDPLCPNIGKFTVSD